MLSVKAPLKTLRDMIAIPSVNPMGRGFSGELYSEKNMADYAARRLRALDMDVVITAADPEHPCVVGRLDVGASETLLLEAHMDTVSHENMSIAPFDPEVRDGRVYGRGSCDTKASLALYIDALEILAARGIEPAYNLVVAGVSEEEFSFGGVRHLLEGYGLRADFAVVGEPTELNMLIRHKGVLRFYVRAEGKSCHSSTPELGHNAIYAISRAILALEQYHQELLTRPAHPLLGHASLSVGLVGGGQTVNTVPGSAWIEVDRRLLPGESPEQVMQEIRRRFDGQKDLRFEDAHVSGIGLDTPQDERICSILRGACARCGEEPAFTSAAFGTNAPFYADHQIPVVVFGPGSIAQAHTADEYVATEQLERGLAILVELLEKGTP